MFIKKAFFFLLLISGLCVKAQVFDFDAGSRTAYNAAIALKLDESSTMLAAAEKKNPDNLITVYLQNYIDFLRIYTTDTRAMYDKLKTNKDIRLSQLMAGDPGSPYYLFTQAEVNLQWAALSIKFGEYVNAIFEIRKAYKALEQNQNRFPDFKANKKSLGVLYALLGSVPDKYKWGLNLLGMEGSVQKGINYLKEVTEYGRTNDFIYQEETITFYAFLLLHLQNDAETAWNVLQQNGFPKKDNLMNVYTCAHVGIYGKHTGPALQLLLNRPTDAAFTAFPFLNYLTGLAKLNQLEPDADTYFKQYIAAYKGDNHIKSSYQKIAWGYLLKGDTTNYRHFTDKVLHHGGNTLDADKQAQKEAESGRMPLASLLRARLLFDGGYYERAAGEMNRLTENSFANTEDQTEYYYRTARIYDEWNKKDSALALYGKAIDKGKNLPRYFAANSAFETGKIYEGRGDTVKAEQFYNLCLSFENHEYKNGLDQKAKAGLNRIK